MQIVIKLFGIAREIIGQREMGLEIEQDATVEQVLERLKAEYPKMQELHSLAIAKNQAYTSLGDTLSEADELALIPPVSGG